MSATELKREWTAFCRPRRVIALAVPALSCGPAAVRLGGAVAAAAHPGCHLRPPADDRGVSASDGAVRALGRVFATALMDRARRAVRVNADRGDGGPGP